MKNEEHRALNEIGFVTLFTYGKWHIVDLENWLNSSKPFIAFAKKLEEKKDV